MVDQLEAARVRQRLASSWVAEGEEDNLGGEGVRAHGVKESLLIYRTTETMIVGYDVGGSDPAFVILGGRWCGRKPDARSRHFSARAARVTRIALQGKFRNMADEKIQAPARAITASMRGLRGAQGAIAQLAGEHHPLKSSRDGVHSRSATCCCDISA